MGSITDYSKAPVLSRLTLGTVQLGMAYGVANRSGRPGATEVRAMLEEAAAGGINCLDTARAYGESESVLGDAMADPTLRDHFQIVTKTDPEMAPDLTPAAARAALRESIQTSLRHLRRERVAVVLLHRDTNPAYLDALAELKGEGLMEHCGVSVTEPANAARLLEKASFEAIQAPLNVLDRRFEAALQQLAARGALTFSRSCYLQGLLLLEDEATPSHLRAVAPARDFLRRLAREHGLPLPELLLRAALSRPEVASVVVGMETLAQLRENLRILQAPPLSAEILVALRKEIPAVPAWVANPPEWNQHAR